MSGEASKDTSKVSSPTTLEDKTGVVETLVDAHKVELQPKAKVSLTEEQKKTFSKPSSSFETAKDDDNSEVNGHCQQFSDYSDSKLRKVVQQLNETKFQSKFDSMGPEAAASHRTWLMDIGYKIAALESCYLFGFVASFKF